MDAEQADLLEHAQLLQKAKAIQSKGADASGNGMGSPGVAAMGTDQPTPKPEEKGQDWVDVAKSVPEKLQQLLSHAHSPLNIATNPTVQHAAGKALDYAGGIARTAGAQVVGAFTPGENPIGRKDWMNAATGNAPGVGDMAVDKFGMGNPSVDIPFTNNKKLEARDIVNLIGNTATNPLTYGAAGAVGKRMYNNAIRPIEVEGQTFNKADVGDTMYKHGIANPLKLKEKVQGALDNIMDKRDPILSDATRKGAQVDTGAAAASAQNYIAKLKAIANPQLMKSGAIEQMQGDVDALRNTAAKPPQPFINDLPYTRPGKVQVPQEELPGYKTHLEKVQADLHSPHQGEMLYGPNGTDGRPLDPKGSKLSPVLDENTPHLETSLKGWATKRGDEAVTLPKPMVEKDVMIPKNDEPFNDMTQPDLVNPHKSTVTMGPTPKQVSSWKTATGNDIGQNGWRNEGKGFEKALYAGQREAVEKSVADTLGAGKAQELIQHNKEAGNLLATGKAQTRVGNQAQRDADIIASPFPSKTEGIVGAVSGAHGGVGSMLTSGAIMRAMRALNLAQMPVGYGLRSMDPKLLQLNVLANELKKSGEQNGR